MPKTPMTSPYLTLSEAAAFLRLAPRTLDNMRQRGTGPLYGKHGGRVRYHHEDLVAWADQTRRRTTTEREPKGVCGEQSRSPHVPDGQGKSGPDRIDGAPSDSGS